MAGLAAQQKYSCHACGGEAVWRPDRQRLVCESCGAELPMESLSDRRVAPQKYSLDAALKAPATADAGVAPEAEDRIAVQCQGCRAISEFGRGKVADHCQFCGAAEIIPYNILADRFRPESLLPFKIDRNLARDRLQAWYRSVWLAPSALRHQARLDTYAGVYLPFWLFDAEAKATWQGKGAAWGTVQKHYIDFPVPASRGVDWRLLRQLAPFATDDLVGYDAQYIAGFTVERYQVQLPDGVTQAREWMKQELLDLARAQVSKDRAKVKLDSAEFHRELFHLALLPIWLLTYRYAGKAYHVAINGTTGEVAGNQPYSPIKVALAILAAVEVFLFFQDAEFAIKLPFWLIEGLWRLIRKPFSS